MEWSGITVLAELEHESERQRCNRNSMRLRLQLKEQTSLWKAEGISQASSTCSALLFRNVILSCHCVARREWGVAERGEWPLKMHKRCARHIELCNDCRLQRATCNVPRFFIHPQQQFFRLRESEREGGRGTGLSCNYSPDPLTRSAFAAQRMGKRIERGNAKQTMSNACQFDLIMSGICNKWVKLSVDSVFAALHTHLQLLLFATPLPTGQHSVVLFHLGHFQPQLIS